jgi:O-6-methylguanine DNA methyltransferase
LLLVASERGLRYVTLLNTGEDVATHLAAKFSPSPAPTLMPLDGFFASTVAAMDRYLRDGTRLKIPYDLAEGTHLQRAVWLEIARIPYGKTISYTTLAERVGFPRAIRAVASACGANPVPLAIPCHRVIAKDGSLGGFSLGGLEVKEKLLRLEDATLIHSEQAA